jgi:long-chain-fatty-acyl-CoA reductase
METIEFPILVAGERRYPTKDVYRFEYNGDLTVVIPRLTPEDVSRILHTDRKPLRDLSIDEVTIFFDRVAQAFREPSNPWRRQSIALGTRVTGYPENILDFETNVVTDTLARAKQYDFISTDLGDPALLDEWVPTQAVYRRCWPAGLVTHVMVGNVPLAGLFTLYRSLVTKNVTVAKLPRRDVITALCFSQCMYDVDPQHPVTRALSTVYWQRESDLEDRILAASDVVSVWGRGAAVESVKRRLPSGTECVEFGPKRSFGVVLDGVSDWDRAAKRAAHDISVYDQEACFSLQEIFILGAYEQFTDALACWLERGSRALRRRPLSPDDYAHIQRARVEAAADGFQVIAPQGTDWTIVVTDGATRISEHPHARFVYVHPVASVKTIAALVDRDVQTVSVEPWAQVWDVANVLGATGVDRFVPFGRMTVFRPGFIHDGFHPMRRMVRWQIIERDLSCRYRFAGESEHLLEEMIITRRLTPRDSLDERSSTAPVAE